MVASVIKVGVAYVNVRALKHLKELTWAIDKWLQVSSNCYLKSYTTKNLKNKAVLNLN